MKINSIVLSAGKGTRMKSELPKVVQKVLDYEMVNLVLKNLTEAGITDNYLVVGYKKEEVIKRVNSSFKFDYVEQNEQLGTGHAVKMANDKLSNEKGITIVTCGDTPLITAETFAKLINEHKETNNDLTVLTAKIDNPTGYGRIIRDESGLVKSIVEQKDTTAEQAMVNEINTGIYCFDNEKLFKYVNDITNENAQEEYYLTDLVEIFNKNNEKVGASITDKPEETLGVNDLRALSQSANILKETINEQHQINGVNILDPKTTYIGVDVKIAAGTVIEPNVTIMGKSKIGPNNIIKASSYIEDTTIGTNNEIGPMARLRNNTIVEDNCRIGNFAEMKNSKFGSGSKAAHLVYVGDAEIRTNVNFGCGVIIVNYDGKNKHKTIVGNDVMLGSNSNLIAPLEIANEVYVAAGTTVTKNVTEKKLVIGRVKQETKNLK